MKRILYNISKCIALVFFLILLFIGKSQGQNVTGLSNWKLFIDPGHAQDENMGLYGYSEAKKVLRVAWALRDFFQNETDIDTVYLARLTDQDQISLEGRVALANSLGADFYYSIHSDAGPPEANSTLMLYGGWKNNGVIIEKTPQGGAAYGAILDFDLTGAMRIGRRGNFADRVFYIAGEHHQIQAPYLYVNRYTSMASLLSEAGFHTNPGQNMLNMNAEWKVLEALSAYRSFLEWHNIDRPAIGVATGIVKDIETGLAINDVSVSIGDQTYVTDGYESLFNQYSTDPNQLRNGFYFIQGLTPLSTVSVEFEHENYQTMVTDLTIVSNPNGRTHENLSFLDVQLTSTVPATVVDVQPANSLNNLIPGTNLIIKFSRKMNPTTTEAAFSISPTAAYSISWPNQFTMVVNTSQFEYLQDYTITLDGSIATNAITGQFLDGDGDGVEGGNFVFQITMSDLDNEAPVLIEKTPSENLATTQVRPIVRMLFDEQIDPASLNANTVTLSHAFSGAQVNGVMHHYVVNEQSVLHFFPTENLVPGNAYTVTLAAGISDVFNNTTEEQKFQFFVLDQPITQKTVIDDFNSGVGNWWNPQQAGQTLGIITELTSRTANAEVVVHSEGSTSSMMLSYGWDMSYVGTPYIRQYLPPTAPQNNVRFNIDDILQVYVFGDGSNNELRLMIRDGLNQLETHQWITIDWVGWKLVSWDLANDQAFGWVNGNGTLDGANFYMDGFHLRYANGAATVGAIFFDHLHFVKREAIQYPTTLFENWQNYEDFTTNLFPWHTVDVKGDVTWNPAGFTFPGSGQPYAYKVLNPALTTPPITGAHPPVDGDKYLIAMQSQSLNENKWLISPQILVTEQALLGFYARSIEVATYGPERFKVYISVDNSQTFTFDPNNFVKISEGDYVTAPANWTHFEYFLGAYSGQVVRFAIQYVSVDDYMLMLDKFTVGQAMTFNLTLNANPEQGGTVSGAGQYAAGQQLQLVATPSTGYMFEKWTDAQGNQISTQASFTYTMPAQDISLTANFALRNYVLTLNVEPAQGGSVEGAGTYTFGEQVEVQAIAAEGYIFVNWTDRDLNPMSDQPVYVFNMPASNLELTANFELEDFVNEHALQNVSVFPNPSKGILMIAADEPIRQIRIVDMAGKILGFESFNLNEGSLNLGELPDGIYVLQFVFDRSVTNKRIQLIR